MITVYSATWCKPCEGLKQLLETNSIEHIAVDIDKESETSRLAGIRGVPTIIHENGKRLVGAVTLTQLKEFIG